MCRINPGVNSWLVWQRSADRSSCAPDAAPSWDAKKRPKFRDTQKCNNKSKEQQARSKGEEEATDKGRSGDRSGTIYSGNF